LESPKPIGAYLFGSTVNDGGARFNPEARDLDVIVVLDWDRVPPGAPDLPEKNSRKIKWVPMAIAAHEVANRALGGVLGDVVSSFRCMPRAPLNGKAQGSR